MKKLHDKGKGKVPDGTFIISTGLKPSRRLHKIFKGQRLSKRSELAKKYIDIVVTLLKNGELDKTLPRIKMAKEIKRLLGINLEIARGVVTKLKQKKLL